MLIPNLTDLKKFQVIICVLLSLLHYGAVSAQANANLKVQDTSNKAKIKDTSIHYPIKDRRGDFLSQPSNNPFDLRDTSLLKRNIVYDPLTRQYFIREYINGRLVKVPATFSFDDYWKLRSEKEERAYFSQRANSLGMLNRKISRPKVKLYNSFFDRLFGKTDSSLKIEFKPAGEINIRARYQGQAVFNPTLPERARSNGGFDFDANANFSMNASIGDKLRFPINLNSLSNLGFDNQIKLNYKSFDSIENGGLN